MSGVAVTLTDETFAQEIAQAERPVAVIFVADWSSPSRALSIALGESPALRGEDVEVAGLDIGESPAVASALRIRALPTMALFIGGEEKARTSEALAPEACADWILKEAGLAR